MTGAKKPNREEVKAKLREFLRSGQPEDVASLLVHSLNDRAEKLAMEKAKPKDTE